MPRWYPHHVQAAVKNLHRPLQAQQLYDAARIRILKLHNIMAVLLQDIQNLRGLLLINRLQEDMGHII